MGGGGVQMRGVVLACELRYYWRAKPHSTSDIVSPVSFNMLAKPNHDHELKIVVAACCLSRQKPRIKHRVHMTNAARRLPMGLVGILSFRHFEWGGGMHEGRSVVCGITTGILSHDRTMDMLQARGEMKRS